MTNNPNHYSYLNIHTSILEKVVLTEIQYFFVRFFLFGLLSAIQQIGMKICRYIIQRGIFLYIYIYKHMHVYCKTE